MTKRPLGATGLEVSVLGLGCGPLGSSHLTEGDVDALVGAALDAGITLFDTAPSYGDSEARLGRALRSRRSNVVLSTKGGYGVPGVSDWTADVVRLGIDAALGRLRTDVIDLFLLHSCDRATLEREDILRELENAKLRGKIRATGYSGENEALEWAISSRRFDVVECSVNPFDRRVLRASLPAARALGIGVLAKRPLANAAWRLSVSPEAPDVRTYWERAQAMAVAPAPLLWPEVCVRFAAFANGVTSILLGTASPQHLATALDAVARGPLDEETDTLLRDAWEMHALDTWHGVI